MIIPKLFQSPIIENAQSSKRIVSPDLNYMVYYVSEHVILQHEKGDLRKESMGKQIRKITMNFHCYREC